jgi:CRISPR-associated endonuclease/helicase Cas3
MPAFDRAFAALTGNAPFPWQRALYDRFRAGDIPSSCDIPTGLGKTSVIAVWLLARTAGASVPTRLVYVVNRRTVVDQTTDEVAKLVANRSAAGIDDDIAVSTLRGQLADNRAWSADPSKLAVICGTVDMIGSRLLFAGYGIGFRSRPLHAGFLGQDALIVHDEAHLEPAFQHLLEKIEREQTNARDGWPLRVMALTATSRSAASSFGLGSDDLADPVAARRMHSTKALRLHEHDSKALIDNSVALALSYQVSNRAVLVYLRTVDDVGATVTHLRKANAKVQQLTGTMRGLERDRLVAEDPIVKRFLPGAGGEATDTVYLVCTSAGEVGVNLSGDHLICDLTTFESMAQRFGRVNRFGLRDDTAIHVIHPGSFDLDDDIEVRRQRTLDLLVQLRGDASPAALGALDADARRAAFAPEPRLVDATDIKFDAWAMTTIRAELPGRPAVGEYLHGVAEWEPPTTQVAWRDEVDLVRDALLERYRPRDLLDDYPLKPHELLTDRTSRVFEALAELAKRHPDPDRVPLWIIDEFGSVATWTLAKLVEDEKGERRLASATVILPPRHSQPVDGRMTGDVVLPGSPATADVADASVGPQGRLRARVFDGEPPPLGMRLVRRLVLRDDDDADDVSVEHAVWRWYEQPRGASDEGTRAAVLPVLLDVHSGDVEREATRIASRLPLAPGVRHAIAIAARLHDHGKRRALWQRSIGNTSNAVVLAKSGGSLRPLDVTSYRHELGSVVDAERDELLTDLEPAERELALHLIAAHHGRARPHFPDDEMFDPEPRGIDMDALALQIANRFAALQRRFGRWGLAYLESIVRAADYAASAAPSAFAEVER